MSKITRALERATADRLKTVEVNGSHSPEELSMAAEKTLEDIQSWAVSFGPGAPAAAGTQTPQSAANGDSHGENGPPTATVGFAPVPVGHVPGGVEDAGVAPEVWERAIQQCQAQLLESERQATHQQWEQASLQVQVGIYEQLFARTQQQLADLRKRLEGATAASATSEAARAGRLKQLADLRELQACSQVARLAELELRTTSEIVERMARSQQRTTEELVRFEARRKELEETVRRLRSQLGWTTLTRSDSAQSTAAGISSHDSSIRGVAAT